MREVTESQTLEGTWDEIVQRSDDLKGHRLRVTILDGQPNAGMSFAECLAPVHRDVKARGITEAEITALVEAERHSMARGSAPGGDIAGTSSEK